MRSSVIDHHNLVSMAKTILSYADNFEWSVQGFGMLRLYLSGDVRLHVWDSSLSVPSVSLVHDHLQWGLTSTILWGELVNIRYKEGVGVPYHWAQFKAGYDAKQLTTDATMLLEEQAPEVYWAGHQYHQAPSEVHKSVPVDGTVSIMRKEPTADGETARIFWPQGTTWVSAEPREALKSEVRRVTQKALQVANQAWGVLRQ